MVVCVLSNAHNGNTSLILNRSEAASWSPADIPGSSCLGNASIFYQVICQSMRSCAVAGSYFSLGVAGACYYMFECKTCAHFLPISQGCALHEQTNDQYP